MAIVGGDVRAELVSLERACALASTAVDPLEPETVPLLEALGRAPVVALRATEDLVPFARAALDGYAVRAADAVRDARLPVGARIVAGDGLVVHRAGTATAIATGAPLPFGADAVVKWEDVDLDAGTIRPRAVPHAGENVFAPGEDARAGEVLAPAGRALDAGTLALLGAASYGRVAVRRRPRVAVLSTGDELIEPGVPAALGQVPDSNGVLVEALLRGAGADVVSRARCGDDAGCIRDALAAAARDADLVITSGGASQGPRDAVKPALDALGARFAFTSVALRPAKPAALAVLAGAAVLVLPGNPSAAFVAYALFARRLLARLAGGVVPDPVVVRLAGCARAHGGRSSAVLVAVRCTASGLVAHVLANQCSSLAGNAARANAIAVLPPGAAADDGTSVAVELVGNPAAA